MKIIDQFYIGAAFKNLLELNYIFSFYVETYKKAHFKLKTISYVIINSKRNLSTTIMFINS